jgi:uncharacterized SAM-binding protein YcdF (DUF218 family)
MPIIKSFATPIVWILILLATGLILTKRHRRNTTSRIGWYSVLFATVLLFLLSLKPVANLITYPLESWYAYPSAAELDSLDIVVVLGGGTRPSGGLRRDADLTEYAYPRLYHGVRVFKESGAKLLAFCGGPPVKGATSEAEVMRGMALCLGVPEERILTETRSRNTMQNAAGLAQLLPAGKERRIGLVTSAAHMPRSRRVFSRQFPQDTIVPIAVCYTCYPVGWRIERIAPSVDNLNQSTAALHEWIAMLWYAVRY